MTSPTDSSAPAALRLTFLYDGPCVLGESERRLERPAPPSDSLDYEEEAGFWSELRDENNTRLYRQVIQNPIRNDVEVFSDDPDATLQRQRLDVFGGSFDLIVPDLPEARTIALYSSPLDVEDGGSAATQLAVFELHTTGDGNS